MNHLNSILIEGEITGLPNLDQTASGRMVCNLTVESRRCYKKENGEGIETYHFSIEAWGQLGQAVFNQAKPGRGLRVVGRLKQSRWNGAADGLPHERVSIVAEHVEFKPEFQKNLKKSDKNDPPTNNPTLFAEASNMVDIDDIYDEEEKDDV
jgi:single-strand DNA-binding protein